jgi:hypothetical protein
MSVILPSFPSDFLRTENIVEKIASILEGIPEFRQVQRNLTLTEDIPELPLIQVYWNSNSPLVISGDNNKITFSSSTKPPIVGTKVEIKVDIYISQRSQLGVELTKMINILDQVDQIFYQKLSTPILNMQGVKGFSYAAERVVFKVGDYSYSGISIVISLNVF